MFQEIKYSGMRFPANLDTPYAVAQVLCQEPGKLRIKDLREGNHIATSTKFSHTRGQLFSLVRVQLFPIHVF